MGKSEDLQATEEETEQAFIEDLLVLGILVLHDSISEESQALTEQLTAIALKVFGLRVASCLASTCS